MACNQTYLNGKYPGTGLQCVNNGTGAPSSLVQSVISYTEILIAIMG